MKLTIKSCLLITCLLAGFCSTAQENQNHLLWRITGKYANRPSYLFGTVHIQDRRVFNFPDSLYTAIGNCTFFSLEINADSISNDLSGYLTQQLNDESTGGKKLKNVLDEKELRELKKKLGGKKDVGELTVKQAYLLRDKLAKSRPRKDDMPVFMDAFLYSIAKDKGKSICGLEQLEDQLKILEETPMVIDPRKFTKSIKGDHKKYKKLVDLYLDNDLEDIQKWFDLMPDSTEDAVINKRNRKMMASMDSIMSYGSLFTAVGAAHLPGNKGLINLLRQAGFQVEPVICNSFTHASQYQFSRESKKWVDVSENDEGYFIKMPGKPGDVEVGDGAVKMKMFYDITANQGFYVGHIVLSAFADSLTIDSLMDKWAYEIIKNSTGEIPEQKPDPVTSKDGIPGKQYGFNSGTNGFFFKIQTYAKDKDVYLIMTNAKDPAKIAADSFFTSFKTINKAKLLWKEKVMSDDYLSVIMPNVKIKKEMETDADSTMNEVKYTAVDPQTGTVYLTMNTSMMVGYCIVNDTVMFHNIKMNLEKKGFMIQMKRTAGEGNVVMEYETDVVNGLFLKGQLIYRGSRVYNVLAASSPSPGVTKQIDSFLKSVALLPYPELPYSMELSPDGMVKTYSPVAFKNLPRKPDTTAEIKKIWSADYRSWDSVRLLCFDINLKRLSPYYWVKNDTLVLKQWLTNNKSKSDSLGNITYNIGKNYKTAEANCYKKNSVQIHRLKVTSAGRTRAILECTYPPNLAADPGINDYYNKFTFVKPDSEEFQSSPELYLKDLHSADSVTFKKALTNSDEVFFTKKDIPVLLDEIPKIFVLDTADEVISNALMTQLKNYVGELTADQLETLYKKLPKNRCNQHFAVLEMLISLNDSVGGFATMKHLMVTNPPVCGSPYMLSFKIRRHPELMKTLFPDWYPLYKDSISGGLICNLVKMMIDSNMMSADDLNKTIPVFIAHSMEVRTHLKSCNYAYSLFNLLKSINTKESIDEIGQYQFVNDNYLRYEAIAELLKNKRKPDPKAIDSLAADRTYRLSIYNDLEDNNEIDVFPKRFLQRQYFAESLISSKDEDNDFTWCHFIGEKSIKVQGENKRYLLFEFKRDRIDTESYLGVAGPYGSDKKELLPPEETDISGISSKEMDKNNLEAELEAYIAENDTAHASEMQ